MFNTVYFGFAYARRGLEKRGARMVPQGGTMRVPLTQNPNLFPRDSGRVYGSEKLRVSETPN
jgi:hypothetical protein